MWPTFCESQRNLLSLGLCQINAFRQSPKLKISKYWFFETNPRSGSHTINNLVDNDLLLFKFLMNYTSEWHLLWPAFELVFRNWTLGLFLRSSSKSSSEAKGAFFKLGLETEEVKDRLNLAHTFSYTVELCLLGDLNLRSSSGSSTGGIFEAAAASSGKIAGIIT